ncbi:hypothetical protein ACOSQ4_001031 [Xanthoceras sorbifolium]
MEDPLIVQLEISRALNIKRIVKTVHDLYRTVQEGYLQFLPGEVLLEAYTFENSIQGKVELDRRFFSHYIYKCTCSYTFKFVEFSTVVDSDGGFSWPYVGRFIWQALRMKPVKEALSITSRVWIYPSSFPVGEPPVLMFSIPETGDIMYYFPDDN